MTNVQHLDVLKQGAATWNQWRSGNPDVALHLQEADLSGFDLGSADLSGANLTGANFHEADLFMATLVNAQLDHANFAEANLFKAALSESSLKKASFLGAHCNEANFHKANLYGVDLSDADFRNSDLSEADLVGVTFNATNLDGSNFAGSKMANTVFSHIDLRTAKGLGAVEHYAASTIGLDTIYKSGGQIPELFLRGCGVPEEFITYMPSLVGTPIQFYSCFISYSHADKSFARRLHDALQGRGIRCWLDEHQLLPGHDIYEEVDRGLKLWDKVLLCASEASLTSWWVDNEISTAFTKEQTLTKARGKKVRALIPLNLDGYLIHGWENGKAEQVRTRLAADFTGWGKDNAVFEREFERLVKALRTDEGRQVPPTSLL